MTSSLDAPATRSLADVSTRVTTPLVAINDVKSTSSSFSCLSDKAILSHMEKGTVVIEPFHSSHLSTSSYDVTLGKYFFRESDYEAGSSIFNPYSQDMVAKVWGKAQTAENAGEWMKRTQIKLDNIDEKDEIIWLKPGETILGHTNEFIGGKDSVTTMMKARSSMGRTFIETCKCFPKQTRLLTQDGFKFVEHISEKDKVATYNPKTDKIEYHHPTMTVKKTGKHTLIRAQQKPITGNNPSCLWDGMLYNIRTFDITTTEDHHWYVRDRFGMTEASIRPERNNPYRAVSAEKVLYNVDRNWITYTVMNSAGKGSTAHCPPQHFFKSIGLCSNFQICAFMAFYGMWLMNGLLEEDGTLTVSSNEHQRFLLLRVLEIMGLKEGSDFLKSFTTAKDKDHFSINPVKRGSFMSQVFQKEYGSYFKNLRDEDIHSKEIKEESSVEPKVCEFGVFDWVKDIHPQYIHAFVDGLVAGSGSRGNPSIIHQSVRFRDQIMQILVHGGFAPNFVLFPTRHDKDNEFWEGMTMRPDPILAHKTLRDIMSFGTVGGETKGSVPEESIAKESETKNDEPKESTTEKIDTRKKWHILVGCQDTTQLDRTHFSSEVVEGDVYCITVPNHLVFAQTAWCDKEGNVEECSKPVIIGNCAGWGDIGFTNRWAMEITNNSRYYSIPLVVGRRIAQIVFFDTEGAKETTYEINGKYQKGSKLEDIKKNWRPEDLLPKMYLDREITQGPTKDVLEDDVYDVGVKLTTIVTPSDTSSHVDQEEY